MKVGRVTGGWGADRIRTKRQRFDRKEDTLKKKWKKEIKLQLKLRERQNINKFFYFLTIIYVYLKCKR